MPAHLESDAGAQRPVLRLEEVVAALHLGADLDAELPEHIDGDEHIGDAARLVDIHRGAVSGERQRGQQARNQL